MVVNQPNNNCLASIGQALAKELTPKYRIRFKQVGSDQSYCISISECSRLAVESACKKLVNPNIQSEVVIESLIFPSVEEILNNLVETGIHRKRSLIDVAYDCSKWEAIKTFEATSLIIIREK